MSTYEKALTLTREAELSRKLEVAQEFQDCADADRKHFDGILDKLVARVTEGFEQKVIDAAKEGQKTVDLFAFDGGDKLEGTDHSLLFLTRGPRRQGQDFFLRLGLFPFTSRVFQVVKPFEVDLTYNPEGNQNLCQEVLEDRQSGDAVCTGCGLILEAQAWDTSFVNNTPLEETLTSQTIADCPRRLLHASGDPSKLRSLVTSCCELRMCAASMGLPDNISDLAKQLWSDVSKDQISRGDVRTGLAASCMYFACKMSSVPRTKKSIAAACSISVDVLNRGAKVFRRLKAGDAILINSPTDSKDILSECVWRAGGSVIPVDLIRVVTAKARLADRQVSDSGVLEGKTPSVRAATAISIAMEWLDLPNREKLWRCIPVSQYTLARTLSLVRSHTSVA